MSATNRGGIRKEHDFYATPKWCIGRILERLSDRELPDGKWLEPGAGSGNILKMAAAYRPKVSWTALDIREECREQLLVYTPNVIITDKYLNPELTPLKDLHYDVAIGNPPYNLALDFIKTARAQADHVLFLLRLNFLGSKRRQSFWAEHMPDVYVLPNRPSFTIDGGTDATEYAWFHWHGKLGQREGKLEMLNLTTNFS